MSPDVLERPGVPDVPLALLVLLVELGREGDGLALALLARKVHRLLDELDLFGGNRLRTCSEWGTTREESDYSTSRLLDCLVVRLRLALEFDSVD